MNQAFSITKQMLANGDSATDSPASSSNNHAPEVRPRTMVTLQFCQMLYVHVNMYRLAEVGKALTAHVGVL